MKTCPECKRVYTDETLNFCLEDGSTLVSGSETDESATAILLPSRDLPDDAPTRHLAASAAVTQHPPPASQTKRSYLAAMDRFWLIPVLLLLSVAGAFFAYRQYSSPAGRPIESIAVMPFVNGSGNADLEYLSDGMTETLISSLSQLPDLNVKARSSVFRYKGKETDPKTIGTELSVQTLLNGRVVQRGQDLLLNIELIDARTENVLWSQNYNRRIADLISLQSDIARDVSEKLVTKLSGAERQKFAKEYTADTEAHNLYLRGRYHFNRRTLRDVQRGIEYLQQAVAKDPNYALAFAALADAYAVLPGYSGQPVTETAPRAREAALRSLSLDDNLSEAHAALAFIMYSHDYDFIGSEREFKRSIELDPKNAAPLMYYGHLLIQLGRSDDGLGLVRRGLELEPLSLPFNRLYGAALYHARRYKESEEQLRKTVDLDPTFVLAHYTLSNVYQIQGKHEEAAEAYARGLEAAGDSGAADAVRKSYKMGGWKGFARYRTEKGPPNRPRVLVAAYHAALGDKDRAFQELERAFANRESFVSTLRVEPSLDPLRDDPRFDELLRRIGFPN